MTNIVDEVKRVIEENIQDAPCGIFDCRNLVGDTMDNLFMQDGVSVDICYGYMYFEIFGLCDEDFQKLKEFYMEKRDEWIMQE